MHRYAYMLFCVLIYLCVHCTLPRARVLLLARRVLLRAVLALLGYVRTLVHVHIILPALVFYRFGWLFHVLATSGFLVAF